MRKIPTVFVRDWDGDRSRVTREPDPSCAWVFAGRGRATREAVNRPDRAPNARAANPAR